MVTTVGCGKGRGVLSDYNYVTSGYVNNNGVKYEIHKCIDEDTVIITEDDKVYKIIKRAEFISPTRVLELPESDGELNIKERTSELTMTWNSTLVESREYINFLQKAGYEIKFEARTEAFIELYLYKDKSNSSTKYKRIVITEDSLMETELDSILFDNIEMYII